MITTLIKSKVPAFLLSSFVALLAIDCALWTPEVRAQDAGSERAQPQDALIERDLATEPTPAALPQAPLNSEVPQPASPALTHSEAFPLAAANSAVSAVVTPTPQILQAPIDAFAIPDLSPSPVATVETPFTFEVSGNLQERSAPTGAPTEDSSSTASAVPVPAPALAPPPMAVTFAAPLNSGSLGGGSLGGGSLGGGSLDRGSVSDAPVVVAPLGAALANVPSSPVPSPSPPPFVEPTASSAEAMLKSPSVSLVDYPVRGVSYEQIARDLDLFSTGSASGQKSDFGFTWILSWTYTIDPITQQPQVKVSPRFNVELPRWIEYETASSFDRERWWTYRANLTKGTEARILLVQAFVPRAESDIQNFVTQNPKSKSIEIDDVLKKTIRVIQTRLLTLQSTEANDFPRQPLAAIGTNP